MRPALLLAVGCCVAACAGSSDDPGATTGSDTANSGNTADTVDTEVQPDSTATTSNTPSDDRSNERDPNEVIELITGASWAGRVDLEPTGNRRIEGAGAFGAFAHNAVALPPGRTAVWLLPSSRTAWLAVLDDGSMIEVEVAEEFQLAATPIEPPGTVDPDDSPPVVVDGTVLTADVARSVFENPLPDTRVITDGTDLFALSGPTDRYDHAVLGDALEASGVEAVRGDGAGSTEVSDVVAVEAPDVIEAVSPMLADVDGDGALDIVVTQSNADSGARIVAYSLDGEVIAASEPIGTGNRWLNLLAVAPTGPDGAVEVIAVRTPHIGGTLEFFRDDGAGRLERVATADGYSTHVIGSRNLDLGIVTDADGDGAIDVLLPRQDRAVLAIVTRDDESPTGTREVSWLRLSAEPSSNVSATGDAESGISYAVGTADGRITVWAAPAER